MKLLVLIMVFIQLPLLASSHKLIDYAHLFPIKNLKINEFISVDELSLPDLVFEKSLRLFGVGRWRPSHTVVLGTRLDPCFQTQDSPKCHWQIRLVVQSVPGSHIEEEEQKESSYVPVDTAAHLLYEVSPEIGKEVLAELVKLRQGDEIAKDFLGVHPSLSTAKKRQEYKEILLQVMQKAVLKRATFFASRDYTRWEFDGFEVVNGRATPMQLENSLDGYIQELRNGRYDFSQEADKPSRFPELECLESREVKNVPGKTREEVCGIELHQIAQKLEEYSKPARVHVDNGDCISCHLAGPFTGIARKLYQKQDDYGKFRLFINQNVSRHVFYEIADGRGGELHNLRHFGYFNNKPIVSLRVRREIKKLLRFR